MMNFFKITVLSLLMLTPMVSLLADENDAKWCASDDGINFLRTYQRGTDDVTSIKWRDNVRLLGQSDRQKVESSIISNADKFSPSGRAVAAYALGCIGGDASVPLLGKWAQSKDTGADAIRALVMLNIPAANQQLANLLPSVDENAKTAIFDALAEKRDASLVKAAASALKGDAKLAAAALNYLSAIGSDEAIGVIGGYKPDSAALQSTRAWALIDAGERAVKEGRVDQAAVIFKNSLNDSGSEPVRLAAAQGLLQAQGVAALKDPLIDLLKGNDQSFRLKLARVLVVYPTPEPKSGLWRNILNKLGCQPSVADTLGQSFADFPDDVQLVLLRNISNLQVGKDFMPVVKAGLKAKSADVQVAAIEALGVSGDEGSFDLLAAALKDPASSDAAVKALSHLQGREVSKLILQSASSAANDVKAKWLAVVALRADHDSLPFVIESAKSAQPEIRSAAFSALKNVTNEGDLSALVDLHSAASTDADKKLWPEALIKVAKSRAGDAQAVVLLKPLLDKSEGDDLQTIAAAVAAVDSKDATDALHTQLASPDVGRRKDVIRSLSTVRNQTSLSLLEESAAKGQDPAEKILAMRGLLDTLQRIDLPLGDKLKAYERAWKLASRAEDKDAISSALKNMKKREADALLAKLGA